MWRDIIVPLDWHLIHYILKSQYIKGLVWCVYWYFFSLIIWLSCSKFISWLKISCHEESITWGLQCSTITTLYRRSDEKRQSVEIWAMTMLCAVKLFLNIYNWTSNITQFESYLFLKSYHCQVEGCNHDSFTGYFGNIFDFPALIATFS